MVVTRADPVEIRPAEAREREAACRLIFDPPGPEMAGIVGDEARARELGFGLLAQG